jgi:hypothetical protein
MGIRIGIGNRIGKSSGGSWISYWAKQSEVLFFGLYSEISGGQMPNKVTGATDYLTVAGVAGSETYICPNTAPYIAADTDYIWFRTDAARRTVTTAELIGYDLQRTPVKYLDNSPYTIVAIIILNSAVTGTKRNNLFKDMWLPYLWDNSANFTYGHAKDNRLVQIPKPRLLDTFTDTNSVQLQNHVMDFGLGWTAVATWIITSNKLAQTATGASWYSAITEAGKTDIDISCDLTVPNATKYTGGLRFRYQDATHGWQIHLGDNNAIPYFELQKDGTMVGSRYNVTQTVGRVYNIRAVTVGNVITIYLDGLQIMTTTDAAYNDKTKCGVTAFGNNTGYILAPIDNFKLY